MTAWLEEVVVDVTVAGCTTAGVVDDDVTDPVDAEAVAAAAGDDEPLVAVAEAAVPPGRVAQLMPAMPATAAAESTALAAVTRRRRRWAAARASLVNRLLMSMTVSLIPARGARLWAS